MQPPEDPNSQTFLGDRARAGAAPAPKAQQRSPAPGAHGCHPGRGAIMSRSRGMSRFPPAPLLLRPGQDSVRKKPPYLSGRAQNWSGCPACEGGSQGAENRRVSRPWPPRGPQLRMRPRPQSPDSEGLFLFPPWSNTWRLRAQVFSGARNWEPSRDF